MLSARAAFKGSSGACAFCARLSFRGMDAKTRSKRTSTAASTAA